MIKELKVARNFAGRVGAMAGASVIALTVWMGLGGSMSAAPPVDPTTCLPTCAVDDSKMLVVAGNDDTTLAAVAITLGLSYTVADSPLGNFQLFDGDADLTNWDTPYFISGGGTAPAPQLIIEVFADPAGVGAGADGTGIHRWTPGQPVTDPMVTVGEHGAFPTTNNAFNGVQFPHDPAAQSGSNYKYAVKIRPQNPAVDRGWNAFKLSAAGRVLLLGNQVVGFTAALNGINDINIVYPNFDINDGFFGRSPASLAGTTYNGTWSFQTTLPSFLNDVTIQDGDMDFGANDCDYNDTDDPDTPAGIPPFADPVTTFNEGVAQAVSTEPSAKFCNGVDNTPFPNNASGIRTGLPADDNGDPLWERDPLTTVPNGIAYKLVSPGSPQYPAGQTFINANPSGNREWEQFKIQLVATGDFNPLDLCPVGGYPEDIPKGYAASDCRTDVLPGGIWNIELEGMDMQNLNFWFFSGKVEPPEAEYSIGRLVWYDANSNAVQDFCGPQPCVETEPGIAGVTYTVVHFGTPGVPDGTVERTGVTDVNGEFLETLLPPGNYRVIIDATNFNVGAPLENLVSTTGGEVQSNIEVGLPLCTDTNVPVGCGEPQYDEALFGYVEGGGLGRNSLTTATCQQYVDGTIAEANQMQYTLSGNNIGGVTPGGLFFWTTVTVGLGEAVTVVQTRTGAGAGILGLHGNQARLLTTSCGTVTGWTGSQDPTTGTISFPAVPAGTYVIQVKWFPKSLSGKPKPVPDTIEYTFAAALDNIVVPLTENNPALALVKK